MTIGAARSRRRRRLVYLAAAACGALVTIAAPMATVGSAHSQRDRDCADFATQAEAQDYFESLGGPQQDPDSLDGDSDGRACEDLPCPCGSGGGDGGDGGGNPGGGSGVGQTKRHAVVSDIADGDTIEVRLRGRLEDVRFIGIDTPEIYFGAECGAAQASGSIKRMLQIGDRVKLIRDRSQDNRDHYDRLLRYVVHSGRDIGRRQIRRGWAKVYVFESPFDRLGSFRRTEREARRADRGVWAMCGGDFHQPL